MKKKRWSRLGALFLMANVTLAACQQQGVELSMIGVDEKQSEGVRNVAKGSFSLTTQANPDENMIRLDWTEVPESTYKVYQKKEGSDEFQTISMTDLSKSQQIQVLNIYPDYCWINSSACSEIGGIYLDSEFTTWDGETLTLPQSARLKRWMEEPTSGYPKGYGMGIIEVTPLAQSE